MKERRVLPGLLLKVVSRDEGEKRGLLRVAEFSKI